MYFDRFDVCCAWYLYLSEYHGGQCSEEYRRLSKMTRYFRPSILFRYETLSDNAKEIYNSLKGVAENV